MKPVPDLFFNGIELVYHRNHVHRVEPTFNVARTTGTNQTGPTSVLPKDRKERE